MQKACTPYETNFSQPWIVNEKCHGKRWLGRRESSWERIILKRSVGQINRFENEDMIEQSLVRVHLRDFVNVVMKLWAPWKQRPFAVCVAYLFTQLVSGPVSKVAYVLVLLRMWDEEQADIIWSYFVVMNLLSYIAGPISLRAIWSVCVNKMHFSKQKWMSVGDTSDILLCQASHSKGIYGTWR
jgi:hypothetical protein